MVFITGIHTEGGASHEHITDYKWRNPENGKEATSYVEMMVDFIENKKGVAKVTDGQTTVDVGVVNGENGKYLRTYANGKWTDNLLSLPRF